MNLTCCISLLGIIVSLSAPTFAADCTGDYNDAIAHIKTLPAPPEGFQWAVNPKFTDEFSAKTLDDTKWFAKSPYWRNGRPPATFKAENVSVKDGFLVIKNTLLAHPEGVDGKEGDTYKYAGGAVASKANDALYGYYETRMRGSKTTMSSTFWLMGLQQEFEFITSDGKLSKELHCTELDIVETVGMAKFKDWDKMMNSNTHYRVVGTGEKKETFYSKGCKSAPFEKFTHEEFHTYGCWWIDANTIKFYCDGKLIGTVNPKKDKNDQPFSMPMYLHLVTETYDFQDTPTAESLQDESGNKTYYDWVRSYRLVPVEKPKTEGK